MGFTEKLDILLKSNKMNKNMLSKETGIPYTTIDSFYKKGADNIKLSNLKKIADYFDVSLDYLVDDNIPTDANKSKDDSEVYYSNKEVAEYAELLLKDKELRMLFDASRNVSKEDLEFVVEMVKKFRRD